MDLNNVDMDKLTGIIRGAATPILKGEEGNDSHAWVEDIVQDTLVALLEYDKEVQDVYNLGHVIGTRRALTYKVGDNRRKEIEYEHGKAINRDLTGQSAEALAADPFDNLVAEEASERFESLSPILANTLHLVIAPGETVSTAAEKLGISPNALYQRLWQIREITGDNNNE